MSLPEAAFPLLHLRVHYDDGVPVLVVPDDVPLAGMRDYVRERIVEVLPDLGGRAARIHLGERELNLFDLRRLLHMLRDDHKVEITGIYVRDLVVRRFAERELKLKLFVRPDGAAPGVAAVPGDAEAAAMPGMDDLLAALAAESDDEESSEVDPTDAPERANVSAATTLDLDADDNTDEILANESTNADEAPESFDPPAAQRRAIPLPELPRDQDLDVDDMGGRRVLTVRRTLRSGSAIRYDGDVYVFGDVNAGAQIKAGGSVIIFGRLRGQVHAGAQGDESATILAFELGSTQLRIAKQIAITPDHVSEHFSPEIAHVVDGAILIEPYAGRVAARTGRR